MRKFKQRVLLFVSVWLLGFAATMAQSKMAVVSFAETTNDRDAVHFAKKDLNGETCSLIKVVTTQTGFSFDIGSMAVVAVEEKPSEIWVYVPARTAKIKIMHPQLGQLSTEDGYYWFKNNIRTKAGTTYRLVLEAGQMRTIIEQAVTQQYLTVYVNPKDAALEINGEAWIPDGEGVSSKYMNFGEYDYRATAPMYHPAVGRVSVNDPNNPHELTINLRPNYGFLKVGAANADMNGAFVYIDGQRVGTIPLASSDRLKSGQHQVRIVKELYKPFEQTVTISDSATLNLVPELVPNFAKTYLTVPNNAEIWINGVKRGVGSWSGPLEAGTYRFETRLAGHRPAVQTELIREESGERRINLRAPDPIYGSINITSQPTGATIYIDGKEVGTTPRVVRNVLIGRRNVELKKKGYSSATQTVTVEEGQTAAVEGQLSNVARVTVEADNWKTMADIFVDGKKMGKSPLNLELPCGVHEFKAYYKTYKKREWEGSAIVDVDNSKSVITVPMKQLPRNYVKKTHFYLEGDYQFMESPSYGGAVGFYLNRFNVEAGYMRPQDTEEMYWYGENGDHDHEVYNYDRLHLKLGYGIRIGRRIQLTPQVGVAYMEMISTKDEGWMSSTYATSWIGALRMTWAFLPCMQLVVTPEYTGTIAEGPSYERMSKVSENIKAWGSGLNVKAGIALYF